MERGAHNSREWQMNLWPSTSYQVLVWVVFDEEWSRSTQRKSSKWDWDRLIFSPHTTFVVEMGGVIDEHHGSLTPQGIQHGRFPRWSHIQLLTPSNRGYFWWTDGNRCFPSVQAVLLRALRSPYKARRSAVILICQLKQNIVHLNIPLFFVLCPGLPFL